MVNELADWAQLPVGHSAVPRFTLADWLPVNGSRSSSNNNGKSKRFPCCSHSYPIHGRSVGASKFLFGKRPIERRVILAAPDRVFPRVR